MRNSNLFLKLQKFRWPFRWLLICAFGLWFSLTGCTAKTTWATYGDVNTTDLNALLNLQQERVIVDDESELNPIRQQGIKEAALTVGAQGALAKRSTEVNLMLESNRKHLDQSFNFYALIIGQDVLPPVLVEGRNTMNLDNNDTIRIADQTYLIIQQARFVTTPPNWHNYLWLDFPKPDVPDATLLPKMGNKEEIKTWRKYVSEGWTEGMRQANSIFTENLARLKRDYQGMLLYRKLLDEKMISAPVVAQTDLGVTGGGGELTINDRFKRITAHPSLNAQSEEWAPAVAEPFSTVAQPDLGPMSAQMLHPTMIPEEETINTREYVK